MRRTDISLVLTNISPASWMIEMKKRAKLFHSWPSYLFTDWMTDRVTDWLSSQMTLAIIELRSTLHEYGHSEEIFKPLEMWPEFKDSWQFDLACKVKRVRNGLNTKLLLIELEKRVLLPQIDISKRVWTDSIPTKWPQWLSDLGRHCTHFE